MVERNSALRDGLFGLSKPDQPKPLPSHEIVARSRSAGEKGRTLLEKRGSVVDHNSAERGMYSAFETSRVRIELEEKDGYEIWLEAGSKSARSFRIMAARDGKDRVLYRFKKNKVRDGGRHLLKTALQFENLEEHLRRLHLSH